jgi:hypothetical protein
MLFNFYFQIYCTLLCKDSDCIKIAEDEKLTEYEAAGVILWVMWKRLREKHKLKIVK